jgi:hypothetical protein
MIHGQQNIRLYIARRYIAYADFEKQKIRRGRPRSSAEMVTCSVYKRNLEDSLKKGIFFQPGKQEAGNKEPRRN